MSKDPVSKTSATGSGPGGRVEIGDIRAKLEEIRGDAEEVETKAKPYALLGGAGAVVLLIILAFVLGRRRGKRKATWVEIRRL